MPIRIDGTTLKLRGREVILPPLDVRTIRRFTRDGRLDKVMSMAARKGTLATDDEWGALVDLLTAALAVNYPEITTEDVEGMVDIANVADAIDALFMSSGFRRVPQGEAGSPSTGTTSSPTSQP